MHQVNALHLLRINPWPRLHGNSAEGGGGLCEGERVRAVEGDEMGFASALTSAVSVPELGVSAAPSLRAAVVLRVPPAGFEPAHTVSVS